MDEWGIFNDESCDHTEIESLEAGLYSEAEAQTALKERYSDDPHAYVARVEEEGDDEYDDDEDEDDSELYENDADRE